MMGEGADGETLSCWLEPPASVSRLRVACPELVRRTSVLGEAHAVDAEVAGKPSAEAAFGLGLSMLHADGGAAADLGRCWLWVAASMGHGRAAADLAREIASEGANPEPRLPSAELMTLVSEWLGRSSTGIGRAAPVGGFSAAKRPPSMGAAAPADEHYGLSLDDADMGEESPETELPGVVVVPRIGDPASREGRELAKRYQHLIGRKLPYKGRLPDPGELERDFGERFPWAGNLARYLEGQFAMLRASGNSFPKLPPLLLVGPSGCGKTTMLEWLAARCEFPYMTIPIGGTSDSAGLTAVARGWITAQVSAPVQLMAENGCCNPALILDEVDKGVSDTANRNGSVMGALLSILQPPAEGYRDACLMANADITQITFLASANSLAPLTDTFRKRFIVQPVAAPLPEHFEVILPGVVRNEAKRLGVRTEMLPWLSEEDRLWLREAFVGSKCSIRQLEQAYRVLIGERAAEEAMAMMRPN